jgi:hypothetical protein
VQQRKHKKFDTVGTGFLAGMFVPLLIFFVVYLFEKDDVSFSGYISSLWRLHALLKLGSLCVFANLAVFMYFIRLKYDKAAKGVLGATLIYAFVVLISKAF